MHQQALRKTETAISESDRLAALDRYDILDSSREAAFDRIAKLIKLTLGVEIGIVSLMDAHRQWYKAADGMSATEVPLKDSFCKHLLYTDDSVLVVPDTSRDERFRDNPYVIGDPHVKFYAGAPLRTSDGYNIGSVCAIDATPREFSGREQEILSTLAQIAVGELELRRIVTVDVLTGVATRRAFRDDAQKLIALARRHKGPLSCVALDVDHFKKVNDTFGHDVGDEVLVSVARSAASQLRESDLLGRLGGEEFAVLLPHTPADRAFEVAEKLRLQVERLKFDHCKLPLTVSASFGVAALDPDRDDVDTLLAKADEALYRSKHDGRNRSTLWQTSEKTAEIGRRRVLKAGQVIFNGRFAAFDCTVRALWDGGAELQVSSSLGIPDAVTLAMKADGIERQCRVVERHEQRLIVAFG